MYADERATEGSCDALIEVTKHLFRVREPLALMSLVGVMNETPFYTADTFAKLLKKRRYTK